MVVYTGKLKKNLGPSKHPSGRPPSGKMPSLRSGGGKARAGEFRKKPLMALGSGVQALKLLKGGRLTFPLRGALKKKVFFVNVLFFHVFSYFETNELRVLLSWDM